MYYVMCKVLDRSYTAYNSHKKLNDDFKKKIGIKSVTKGEKIRIVEDSGGLKRSRNIYHRFFFSYHNAIGNIIWA